MIEICIHIGLSQRFMYVYGILEECHEPAKEEIDYNSTNYNKLINKIHLAKDKHKVIEELILDNEEAKNIQMTITIPSVLALFFAIFENITNGSSNELLVIIGVGFFTLLFLYRLNKTISVLRSLKLFKLYFTNN